MTIKAKLNHLKVLTTCSRDFAIGFRPSAATSCFVISFNFDSSKYVAFRLISQLRFSQFRYVKMWKKYFLVIVFRVLVYRDHKQKHWFSCKTRRLKYKRSSHAKFYYANQCVEASAGGSSETWIALNTFPISQSSTITFNYLVPLAFKRSEIFLSSPQTIVMIVFIFRLIYTEGKLSHTLSIITSTRTCRSLSLSSNLLEV